ncbi:uncharacterized protein LOC100827841 [Brachypodium distachyon]|uniref:Transposase (putative) gypsy type domain-containing protein n=1 Tax=Brachypodium distachyon TaxID=15368 RepID=A0A0Q3K4B7_BRADI|nr:uncharacterized protein LOC100827841 [Brachypodium distachyon]KQK19308.1 hypothetical protein BRADI_1g47536v3 [Brachypodium distachyon]|eukprot:XP_014758159.1 uncharacterized protein LOC100827841 [Brachypodium distachyon]
MQAPKRGTESTEIDKTMPSSHGSSSSPAVVVISLDSDSDDATDALSTPAAERIASTLRTQEEVDDLCRKHGVPREFSARPAGDDLRASSTPPPGAVCVYAHALEAGVRFPLHAFFCEALNHFSLAPGQLTPNGWRILVGFVALCHDAGVRPSLPVFRRFFSLLNREGKAWYYFRCKGAARALFTGLTNSKSEREWKGGFFFLTSPEPWPCPVRWGEPPLATSNVDPVLTSEEEKSVEKLLGVHLGTAVDLRTYLRKADLAAALASNLTGKSPPPPPQPSPPSSGAKGIDPSAEKVAVVKTEKLDTEPDGEMPPLSGKKRKREESANGKEVLRRREQLSTPPAANLCPASPSSLGPPPGFVPKPPPLPVLPDAHDGDSADWEAARKVLECAVTPSRERQFAAANPSDVVASSYITMLQAANYATFTAAYALELEQKLAARDAEVAVLREQLEKSEAEKESVKAAAV